MNLAKINRVSNISEEPLPTRKLRDLELHQEYYITDLKSVQTKFGERIIAEITEEYIIFLPARITGVFKQDGELFKGTQQAAHQRQLVLIYHGGKYNSIEFRHKEKEL